MAPKGSKLDPAAFDRWWRNRIEKEEGKTPEAVLRATYNRKVAKGETHQFIIPGDHLAGAGAIVKQAAQPPKSAAGGDFLATIAKANSKAGSLASVRSGATRQVDAGAISSKPPSVAAGSHISYPKTPGASQAGKSVTDSAIMHRLAALEQELTCERARREAAEQAMKNLISEAGMAP